MGGMLPLLVGFVLGREDQADDVGLHDLSGQKMVGLVDFEGGEGLDGKVPL